MTYQYFDISQTISDKRHIKGLKLPNDVIIVLISDDSLQTSGCCVGFNTGFSDDEFEGTAHFLEHLLFMGNSINPNHNDFHEFVQNSGGYDNAYTTQTSTCYFITINSSKLTETVLRLSYFFDKPLLREKFIEDEKNIIHSEHEKNINDDHWIIQHLFKKFIKSKKYSKFGTGNYESLNGIKREHIKNFFDKYYCTNNMFVCITDTKPLETMIKEFVPIFTSIPTKKIIQKEVVYMKMHKNNLIIYKSSSELKLLKIFIIFECDEKDFDNSQIGRYIINKMIKSKYEKSLAYYLIENDLCFDIDCDVDDYYDKQIIISLSITLIQDTDDKIIKIIECVNSFMVYLSTITMEEFENFYNNYSNIALLKKHHYKKKHVDDTIIETVENLMRYNKHYCLNKQFIFNDFTKDLYAKFLNIVKSYILKIITNIEIVPIDTNKLKNDEHYKAKYYLTNITISTSQYDFSVINFIIFKDINILYGGSNTYNIHHNIINENKEIYYTSNIHSNFFSNLSIIRKNGNLTINKNILIGIIYVFVIKRILQYYLEPLKDFRMKFDIKIENGNLIYSFSGFNLLLFNYIKHIIKHIQYIEIFSKTNIEKIKQYFKNAIDFMISVLKNEKNESPYLLTLQKIEELLFQNFTSSEKIKMLQRITFEDFMNTYNDLMGYTHETIILIGNVDVTELITNISDYDNIIDIPNKTNKIKYNLNFTFREIAVNEKNNCVCFCNLVNDVLLLYNKDNYIVAEIYEQDIIKHKIIYSFIASIINELMFNELRTNKKIGYIVKCLFQNYQLNNHNIMLIIYLIQSNKSTDIIINLVNEFTEYLKELLNTDIIKEKFNTLKNTKLKEYENERFVNVEHQLNFYLNNILYNCNYLIYHKIELKILKQITYAMFHDIFKQVLNNTLMKIIYDIAI